MVFQVALMILPLATLLAYVASDARHNKEQRDRARDLLLKLNSKFCTAIAVLADWGPCVSVCGAGTPTHQRLCNFSQEYVFGQLFSLFIK